MNIRIVNTCKNTYKMDTEKIVRQILAEFPPNF